LCDQYTSGRPAISATVVRFKQGRKQRNATSSKGRQGNEVYRVREHLTEAEIEKLLAALKQNRYGRRDWLIGLLIFRHGLRVWADRDGTRCECAALGFRPATLRAR
jgi:integrase